MKIHVLSQLAKPHAETIIKTLGRDFADEPPYDWVVFPFVNPGLSQAVNDYKTMGFKTCAYWLGSDSYRALHDVHWRRELPKFDLHIACHDRLADELKQWGITASVLYFLARNVPDHYYEAAEPKVGVYMPSSKGKYWFHYLCDVAANVPELPFVFYGCDDLPAVPANVTNAGRYTPEGASALLRAFSVVLRLTAHDGFPQNVIEMKMQGKNCVTNYPYQGCIHAPKFDDAVKALKDPKTHEADVTWMGWYLHHCSPDTFSDVLKHQLELNENLPR